MLYHKKLRVPQTFGRQYHVFLFRAEPESETGPYSLSAMRPNPYCNSEGAAPTLDDAASDFPDEDLETPSPIARDSA